MRRSTVYITSPHTVDLRVESLDAPADDEVLVRTRCSGISAGTEGLIYCGQAPNDLAADASIDALGGSLDYPIAYGYSAVGTVTETGDAVDGEWEGRRVFAFQPHTTHFVAKPEALIPLPDTISDEEGVFLPNVETAVNLALDGRPLIGERVTIFGQGVLGLLTTAVLSDYPLERLLTLDHHESRRRLSLQLGADDVIDPGETTSRDVRDRLIAESDGGEAAKGADLAYELSGNPEALNDVLPVMHYDGRVVVGSWYGEKSAPIDLGRTFHRERISILSSQVSTIHPSLRGRWSKGRRMRVALRVLQQLDAASMITHRFSVEDPADAYEQIDTHPSSTLQVVFEYPS